jgi:thiamine-monophosphate kinase
MIGAGEDIRPKDEVAALDLLREIVGESRHVHIIKGIGDDCAVLSFSDDFDVLLTVDTVARDVHFSMDWQTSQGIGWRALAASVSDIAAMGGEPIAGVIAVAIEGGWDESLRQIYRGITDLSTKLRMDIVGGDISELPAGFSISLTIFGRVKKGRAIFRDGARPGDDIWVTGTLGGGEAVRVMAGQIGHTQPMEKAIDDYEKIVPRVKEAQFLTDTFYPTSMIDISDGLSTDISHICRSSGVGAVIEESLVPVDDKAIHVHEKYGIDPVELALNGGEDFELCFTSPGGVGEEFAGQFRDRFQLQITKIGQITTSDRVIRDKNGKTRELKAGGFDHLRSRERKK